MTARDNNPYKEELHTSSSLLEEPIELRLKRYEQYAKALFEHNPDVVWWSDLNCKALSVNSRVQKVFGFEKKEFLQLPFDHIFPEDLENIAGHFMLAKKGKPQNFETTAKHRDGHEVALNITFVPVTVDYKIVGVYGIAKDITERKKLEAAIRDSNDMISNILDSITDGFFAVDHAWRITYWNKEAERISGGELEFLMGAVLWSAFPRFVESDIFTKLHKAFYEQATVEFEERINDRSYTFHVYPSEKGLSVYFHDITERRIAEEKIAHLTYYDALTGLPNQRLFKERLNQAIERTDLKGDELAVLLLDLDRFKMFNDTLGFVNGDRLLVSVAHRLSVCLGEEDTISRYEGDKFAVLLRKVNRFKIEYIVKRIIENFQKPFILDNQEFMITPSMGIGLFPLDGEEADKLIANAETALRRAKESGLNRCEFYNTNMDTRYSLSLERDLCKALEREEFVVIYQPQLNIRTGKIVGAEALVRWRHPSLGLMSPNDFIPLAEETGLVLPIGEWVLREACAQNKAWQEAGFSQLVVSVNLSALQFSKGDIVEIVSKALQETRLEPQFLDLEITESMMVDVERSLVILQELKKLGVRISMDDFGKGYSSLFYLKRFPIDSLKIDQSFVQDCIVDENDATIVKTIISMAHSLNLNVVAEGVENREQLFFLQQHFCNEAQGFFFSKPVAAEEFGQKCFEIQEMVKQLGVSGEKTDRLWTEQLLRMARQDLEDTVRKQQGMTIKFKEQDGRFIHSLCDGELLLKMGFVPEQIIGKELSEFLPHEIALEINEYYRRAWKGEPDVTYEAQVNGIWYMASLRPIQRGGKVVEVIGSCIDIMQRKRAEEALRQSEAKYRLIANNMSDMISVLDAEGIIKYASPSHQSSIGFSTQELEGQSLFSLIHPDDKIEAQKRFVQMFREKTPDQIEFRCKHNTGEWIFVEVKGTPVVGEDGQAEHIIGVARDITDRKKTEEIILKSEKLAVAGELAAGVAHEIRNPITAIKGFVTLLKNNREKSEYFGIMFKEFKNLESKIDEFLMLAKPKDVEFQPVDLRIILQNVLMVLESQAILSNVQIHLESESVITKIVGDQNQLKQAFVNLVINAIEAMPEGGEVRIKLMSMDSQKVKINIMDNGTGMSEQRLKKLGEPFYSNKEKGTGLGLTISYKIIKEHHGFINFTSELNKGTIVEVILPVEKYE
jgi:diguanylate cyclase (GGDEF)-like protein/PAS domain S-box-containing protein